MRYTIDLSGEWNMTMEPVEGTPVEGVIILPGTTAQQRLGVKNPKHEEGYLTEDYPFSGKLTVTRKVRIGLQPGMLAELYLERTRITRVWLDGREMAAEDGTENSLIAAHRYNLTSDVTGEDQELRIEISNTGYPVPGGHMTSGMPEYRIPTQAVLDEVKVIEDSGVKIVCNSPIKNAAELKKDYDVKNIVYNDLGTVIMSHGGKGAMGVWFIRK